jgi:hypothetical protein
MKYTPPKLPLPKTGKAMQIYIANDKRSATAFFDKPAVSLDIEQPKRGRDWRGICRDEKGIVTFDGYLIGSSDAKPREVLGALTENQGLR